MIKKINLEVKNGYTQKEYKKAIYLQCRILDENIPDLAILKECLDKVGISLEANRYDYKTDVIMFSIDHEKFQKVATRNSGRRKSRAMSYKYKQCTVLELKEKLKTMSKTDIAKELGCPRVTLYRILKNLTEYESRGFVFSHHSIYLFSSVSKLQARGYF